MRFNIVDFIYDEETKKGDMVGTSEYGKLYSTSTAHEEDWDIASAWIALDICKYKMNLEYLRLKKNKLHERYLGAKYAINTVKKNTPEQMKQWDSVDSLFEKLQNQINAYKASWHEVANTYAYMKSHYKTWCKEMLDFRRQMRNKFAKEGE